MGEFLTSLFGAVVIYIFMVLCHNTRWGGFQSAQSLRTAGFLSLLVVLILILGMPRLVMDAAEGHADRFGEAFLRVLGRVFGISVGLSIGYALHFRVAKKHDESGLKSDHRESKRSTRRDSRGRRRDSRGR
jgi:hypothetical protein